MLILAVCFLGVYHILSIKDTMGLTGSSINQLKHTPRDTVDVVFLGSSHVYYGISPATLWTEYGISAFDMSISAMDKGSAYHHLNYLLKKQSPDVVFVDIYPMLHERHQVVGNEYRNLLGMPYSIEAVKMTLDYVEKEDRGDFITRFPIIHTRYAELKKDDFFDSGYAVYGRGERVETGRGGNADFTQAHATNSITPLSEVNKKWLDSFVELSEKKNFTLVFYVTPFSTTADQQSIFNAVTAYAADNNITFMDLSQESDAIGLNVLEDYIDPEHMNVYGAAKTSRYIGNYLQNHFSLQDHRGDARYVLWDEDAMYQTHAIILSNVQALLSDNKIEEALAILKNAPGISYIVSLDGHWNESILPLQQYLESLNISAAESAKGGVWIGSGGANTFIMDNNCTEVSYYTFDRYSTARICKTRGDSLENIMVGYESAQYAYNGLSIALYDYYDQKLVKLIGLY